MAHRCRPRVSTPCSATRRGTWCEPITVAKKNRRAARGHRAAGAHSHGDSGLYTSDSSGHANRYPNLFVEARDQLLRGRAGESVCESALRARRRPCAARRFAGLLFSRASVDTLIERTDNRDAVFPIRRSVKFLLATATAGRRRSRLPAGSRRTQDPSCPRFPRFQFEARGVQ